MADGPRADPRGPSILLSQIERSYPCSRHHKCPLYHGVEPEPYHLDFGGPPRTSSTPPLHQPLIHTPKPQSSATAHRSPSSAASAHVRPHRCALYRLPASVVHDRTSSSPPHPPPLARFSASPRTRRLLHPARRSSTTTASSSGKPGRHARAPGPTGLTFADRQIPARPNRAPSGATSPLDASHDAPLQLHHPRRHTLAARRVCLCRVRSDDRSTC